MLIRKIYNYSVLFVTLIMTIGGSVSGFMALTDIIAPASYQQSFEQYKEMMRTKPVDTGTPAAVQPSDEDLRKNYDNMIAMETKNSKQRAVNSLIKSLGWVIIPLPIFLYFQKKLRGKDE